MIIFLDIDGIIATSKSYEYSIDLFDMHAIKALNKLTDALNCEIVISSAWRILYDIKELKEILSNAGVKAKVVGITRNIALFKDNRGKEIKEWLENHIAVKEYMVIDDEISDIQNVIPVKNIIHIKDGFSEQGLTEEFVDKFIEEYKVSIAQLDRASAF